MEMMIIKAIPSILMPMSRTPEGAVAEAAVARAFGCGVRGSYHGNTLNLKNRHLPSNSAA